MALSSKPPTTLQIVIQTLGKREDVADLFDKLNELGVLDRSLDIVLKVGVYYEFNGREIRRQVHELLKTHPAVLRSKSGAHLTTKLMADEKLFETEADLEGDEPEDSEDDEEEDETPLERYAREQVEAGGDESVTLTHYSNGQRGRSVTLTAETSRPSATRRATRCGVW